MTAPTVFAVIGLAFCAGTVINAAGHHTARALVHLAIACWCCGAAWT